MKTDLYQEITDQIIELLESVEIEDYQNPFKKLACGAPQNIKTGNFYKGVNTFALMLARHKKRFTSDSWGTFLQWKSLGASVRKGEKGSTILQFRCEEKENKNTGELEEKIFVSRCKVFNLSQVEGYMPETEPAEEEQTPFERLEVIDNYVTNTGARIIEANGAFYRPSDDVIGMPADMDFLETEQGIAENYYCTLLHELIHWTKAPHRLNRSHDDLEVAQRYAAEELVAELGSAFLCAQFGIEVTGRLDHARYIKSWLEDLRRDKNYIARAARMAQTAIDYLDKFSEDAKKSGKSAAA